MQGYLAFRGGTAIHKLLFPQPLRYSEDIDLIQLKPGPVKPLLQAIGAALAWLGSEREVRQTGQSVKLIYRFAPVSAIGGESRKLKIELNIVEHQALLGLAQYSLSINNPWFKGESRLVSFSAEELLATKFRALLQRHKDRDLFDLGFALRSLNLNDSALVRCFCGYVAGNGKAALTRANIERILLDKLNRCLVNDIQPLLPSHVTYGQHDALEAFKALWLRLVVLVPGAPWKNTASAIESFHAQHGHPVFAELL